MVAFLFNLLLVTCVVLQWVWFFRLRRWANELTQGWLDLIDYRNTLDRRRTVLNAEWAKARREWVAANKTRLLAEAQLQFETNTKKDA